MFDGKLGKIWPILLSGRNPFSLQIFSSQQIWLGGAVGWMEKSAAAQDAASFVSMKQISLSVLKMGE